MKEKHERLNAEADALGRYKIIETVAPGKAPVTREVEAVEIAYDVLGMRLDGRYVVLDHIPTGLSIGRFSTDKKARSAIRELIQLTNFKWLRPPRTIVPAVKEILGRYGL